MKRFLMLLIIFICLVLTVSALSFDAPSNSSPPTKPTPLETINKYSGDSEIIYEISRQMPLLSFSGSKDYTIYELLPYGYAILLNSTNGLLEACYSKNTENPFDMDSNILYYYGGPGVYCVSRDNTLINLHNGIQLDADMIESTLSLENNMKAYETQKAALLYENRTNLSERAVNATSTTQTHYVNYPYFSQLTDYGTNINGTCTIIAVQMLLGYYDYFINDTFVDTVYEEGVGTSEGFHQLLNNYVYGNSSQGGIFIRGTTTAINRYLAGQGLKCELKSEHTTQSSAIDQAIALIRSGNPVIASMGSHLGALYNHSVLLYGVTFDTDNSTDTAVFTMNMGWHNGTHNGQSDMSYVASASWFYECGYIESTCTSHRLSLWKELDSTYHQRNCILCNYYESGMHIDSWDSLNTKCTKCGRTGSSGGIMSLYNEVS